MPDVQLLFGPFLLGTFINMILYGILIVQVYSYFQTYKKETAIWVRILVYWVFALETLNTGFNMGMMYQPLILEFGEPSATKFFPKMFAAAPVVIVAVSTPIQVFFAWRIRLLTKSNLVFVIITLFALVSAAGGIWTTIRIVQLKLFALKPMLHTSALVWFLTAVGADVLITIMLVLNLSGRKTGFSATDDAIGKIIRLTVQTGMITALFAIGDVVFFMTLPHTALNFLWDLALSKLYANCLLSTLNARAALQGASYGSNQRYPSDRPYAAPRRQPDGADSQGIVFSSPLYDLSSSTTGTKPFEHSAPGNDLEYGITVTKVVETSPDRGHPTQ